MRGSQGGLVCLDHRAGDAPIAAAAPLEELIDVAVTPAFLPDAAALLARHAELTGAALREHESVHLVGRFENKGSGITGAPLVIDWMAPDRWLSRRNPMVRWLVGDAR